MDTIEKAKIKNKFIHDGNTCFDIKCEIGSRSIYEKHSFYDVKDAQLELQKRIDNKIRNFKAQLTNQDDLINLLFKSFEIQYGEQLGFCELSKVVKERICEFFDIKV